MQQLLLFIGFFIEEAEESSGELPGCLFASYTYQAGLFEPDVLAVLADSMLGWRRRLRTKLDEVVARHPPLVEVDLDALADAVNVVFEGAFVVSRAVGEPGVVSQQLRLYRSLLRAMFPDVAPEQGRFVVGAATG